MFTTLQCKGRVIASYRSNRCKEERIVASDDRLRELEERYEGYRVYDNAGESIGKVDDLFVDEADREEYIGVKMGFFGLRSTLIPMKIVRVDERERTMEVAESKDHVKDAPTFDDDDDITPEFEERIRRHFGLGSMQPSAQRGSYGRYTGAAGSSAAGATSAEGGMGTEGRAGREPYRDRENLGHSESVMGAADTGDARPSGGLRDLETGERGRTGDEGFREGGGRSEFGDRADLDHSGTVTGSGPTEEGMVQRDIGEPAGEDRMEDERYREGFREGFREGLRAGSGHSEYGDREDLGSSGAVRGSGPAEEGMTRREAELGNRGRMGDEALREGGRRDQATGAARPGDEARERPRRSDEGEQEESGLTRVWRRIRG
jgi:PRC-barrel domain